jgi:uncharacterized membrane-anchored protein
MTILLKHVLVVILIVIIWTGICNIFTLLPTYFKSDISVEANIMYNTILVVIGGIIFHYTGTKISNLE